MGAFVGFLALAVLLSAAWPRIKAGDITSSLISPVKDFGELSFAGNIWEPQPAVLAGESLDITAKAAFFVDSVSGQVLYSKNARGRLRIASLAKIMTVIVALEHKNFADTYPVSARASAVEPDKMSLLAGETLSLEELLDGIFLVSANDAAEVIAEGTTGDRAGFVRQMNQKAVELGMNDTKFINPTGLEEDDPQNLGQEIDQYSSAYDVALMTRYAIRRWPRLLDISAQPRIYLPRTPTHQDYDLNSGINLLTTYPGVVGFKTGYTPEAGLTLVTIARRGGHEILGVILEATDRRDDARELLDYSFSKLR